MIRARMSFGGFTNLYTKTADSYVVNDAKKAFYQPEEVQAALDAGEFYSVSVSWNAVYTPDPKSANAKWSAATPYAHFAQTIGNPHAVADILQMIEEAKGPNGRKNGSHDTCEFYVDVYAAPSEASEGS